MGGADAHKYKLIMDEAQIVFTEAITKDLEDIPINVYGPTYVQFNATIKSGLEMNKIYDVPVSIISPFDETIVYNDTMKIHYGYFTDDFEGNEYATWKTENISYFTNPWNRTDTNNNTPNGEYSYGTKIAGQSSYPTYANGTLVLPDLTITQDSKYLNFYHKYDFVQT